MSESSVGPGRTDKYAVIPHCVDHIQSHRAPSCRWGALRPHVNAKEKTGVSDRANSATLLCELLQSDAEAVAHRKRFLRDLVTLQDC